MADIAASDITYNFDVKDATRAGRLRIARGSIVLGFGAALTIPINGISLDKSKIGLPLDLFDVRVIESDLSGYQFEFDQSAQKLRLIQSPAVTLSVAGGAAAASTDAISIKSSVINKEAAGADSATVQAASKLVEAEAVAPGADVTLQVECIGA